MITYPRVLIVTKSKIGDVDSAGAALRGWFKEWPPDHIAQIFSGAPATGEDFCARSLQLGPDERRFGKLFARLKDSSLADAALPYRDAAKAEQSGALSLPYRFRRALGRTMVESGLWELIFAPRISPRVASFIEEFKPDAMFVQGCDISFMRLPLLIQSHFGTPIHFDVVDDWVVHLYRGSLVGSLMNRLVQRVFRKLANASVGRFVIGEAMAEAYERRYGLPFVPLMQCDDQERFPQPASGISAGRDLRIVYSGSLALNRWRALLDLAHACAEVRIPGRTPSITIYAPFVPPEAAAPLRSVPWLTVKPAIRDAEVPAALAEADLLFLPESFDEATSEYIKLSVSTKAHLYMMSGRPSLVYGPPGIGTVEYARRHGWAHVVDREGRDGLVAALAELFKDGERRVQIVRRASEVAALNHSGPVVRDHLRLALLGSKKVGSA